MRTVNEQLVRDVVGKIMDVAGSGGWNQDWFADPHKECGTSHCFAGWALRLSGYGVLRPDEHNPYVMEWRDPQGNEFDDTLCGEAARVLGLRYTDAEDLFFDTSGERVQDLPEFVQRVQSLTGVDLSEEIEKAFGLVMDGTD